MNKNRFNEMMNIFAKVYERTIEIEVLTIYFKLFREIPDEQVGHITKSCLKKCHFFPRPADIFSFYDSFTLEKPEIRTTTEEELEKSRQGIRKLREQFKEKKEPVKIGEILKEIKTKNKTFPQPVGESGEKGG